MIRLMPDYGGKRLPEDDKSKEEYLEVQQANEWGQKVCSEIDKLMGGAAEADFCNDQGESLYHVKLLAAGYMYTISNTKKHVAYGLNSLGEIHALTTQKGMDLDYPLKREEVEQDLVAISELIKKEVKE